MKTKPANFHNHTDYTLEQIVAMPLLATTINKWRGRRIRLYQHPADENRVISVGVTFDGNMTVIASEFKHEWETALDYGSRGKVYTSE